MSTAPMPAPVSAAPRGDRKALLLILAIGVQIALIGAYLGLKTVFAGGDEPAHATHAAAQTSGIVDGYGVGSDVTTSFGSIVVGTAQNLGGVTGKALGGNNHNIGAYVPPTKTQVQVTVVITNRKREPIPYSPEQFSLRSGAKGAEIPVTRASIKPATLLPDAAIEATLIFVAPRNGQKLSLAFQDRARTSPFLIDIGHVDTTPPGATAGGHATHP